jgi:hypothetical protein
MPPGTPHDKQELIKVVSVSQGTLNEALAHPREVFKPVGPKREFIPGICY